MKTQKSQLAFVQGVYTCIDLARANGRGQYSNKTLEQIQKEYPGAALVELDPWIAAKEAAETTAPVEITPDQYMEWLEMLPPENYSFGTKGSALSRCEAFDFGEHLSGRITGIYVSIRGRCFTFNGLAGQSLEARVATCATLAAGPPPRFRPMSPDGIGLDPETTYATEDEARAALVTWATQYAPQGHYTTAKGRRIPVKDLADACSVKIAT